MYLKKVDNVQHGVPIITLTSLTTDVNMWLKIERVCGVAMILYCVLEGALLLA
jgi:hypothetical protein